MKKMANITLPNAENDLKALLYMISTKGWNLYMEQLQTLQKQTEIDIIEGISDTDIDILRARYQILREVMNSAYSLIESLESGGIAEIDLNVYE